MRNWITSHKCRTSDRRALRLNQRALLRNAPASKKCSTMACVRRIELIPSRSDSPKNEVPAVLGGCVPDQRDANPLAYSRIVERCRDGIGTGSTPYAAGDCAGIRSSCRFDQRMQICKGMCRFPPCKMSKRSSMLPASRGRCHLCSDPRLLPRRRADYREP